MKGCVVCVVEYMEGLVGCVWGEVGYEVEDGSCVGEVFVGVLVGVVGEMEELGV